MKIQNLFNIGIIDKDSEGRFVSEGKLIDAENFFVNTLEGSGGGVGKNALGNALKTAYNITGGHTVGHGANTSENKVYNFIKGTNHDYIIEYDSETFASAIVAQSTTGTRLNFRTGERITNVEVISGNTVADTLLMFSGDSNPPRILNIARSKTWGVDGFTAEEIMLIKAPPLYPPTVTQINTLDEKENFLEDKYVSFATRYKYKDNYYSAISSWQEYAFTPDRFSLDIGSCENKGMINTFNGCDITFITGPREVIAVDLLFKFSNSTTVYKVDQYIKTEESWADNVTIPAPIRFTNNKIFSVLPEDQYFRSYDNVPESVVAGTIAGNRVMYANYVEGKDLIDKNGNPVVMDYTVGVSSLLQDTETVATAKISATSLFDASSIVDGKIRLDFTGTSLKKDGAISVLFNIKSIPVVPALTPDRSIFIFDKPYVVVLDKDYANITAVITDDAINGFKSGIEGYLSDLFKATLVPPTDLGFYSLDFPPSLFNGFTVSTVSANIIDIVLPSIKYEIEVLPAGPNTFVKEYMQDSVTTAYVDSIGSKKSMKSYRGYELIALYQDPQGRKTTALASSNNTVFIPLSKSTSKNTLTVNMGTTMPPAWATTYKFAIKETIKTYEEIYITDFYVDGNYRWVRLEGTSKNKVAEGDVLLLKRDSSSVITKPIKVKVLEIKTQDVDFVAGGVSETAGLYMKIKPEGFDMPYNPDGYKEYLGYAGARSGHPTVTLTIPNSVLTSNIPQNSILTITLKSNFSNEDEFNNYETTVVATSDYPNFQTFYNAQIATMDFIGDNTGVDFAGEFQHSSPGVDKLTIRGTSDGRNTVVNPKSGFVDVKVTLRTTAGFMIFEKQGIEDSSNIFYETPDVFTITAGNHQYTNHLLSKTFNCFMQGNGAESYQIRDAFNEKYLSIDFLPTAVSADGFKKVNRQTDITYSGVYNSSTNVNRLNEFNLYLANFKEDIEKSYGPILKIKGTDTNIEVYQEDKCSKVYYGKDLLYNADGSTNLTKIEAVLGQQEMYGGEYGISYHPESFDEYAFNSYLTDTKRGIVLKKSNNGLFEISSQGMNSYFKKLFRDNAINQIIGEYDQYHDVFVLNIKYNSGSYVTWIYSDKDNGWLGRITFNPDDLCRINGKFLSFKNGEIYQHNESVRNTFYGIEYPSKFTINFPHEPSTRKNYKTLEIEGSIAPDIILTSDFDKGYINSVDFTKEEGVFKSFTRLSNDVVDTSLLSVQGIGNVLAISGLVLSFSFELDNAISIGDDVRNLDNELVGTITNKTATTLTLNAVANIVASDYVMCSKAQSANVNSLLGYHLEVSGSFSSQEKQSIFAINSEVVKSFN